MGKKQARDLPAGRMVTADDEGLAATFERMGEMLGRMNEGEDPREYVLRGPAIIAEHVQAIAESLKDADAFDVIELMRMREMPMILEGYRESLADQMPAAVELVALILLARGQRAPVSTPTSNTRPAGLIPYLHERAREMLTLGSFALFSSGERNEFGPLTMLSAQFVSHNLAVQFMQYAHLNDEINDELFSSRHLGELLLETLGFSYEDFCVVRESIVRVHREKFFTIRDTVGEMFEQRDQKKNDTALEKDAHSSLLSMMELPGERATLTVQEVAEASGVPADRTQAVLDRFSLSFNDADDALAVVTKFLSGDNPFRSASLVKDADGNYILTGKPIGTDCFRQVVEGRSRRSPQNFAVMRSAACS